MTAQVDVTAQMDDGRLELAHLQTRILGARGALDSLELQVHEAQIMLDAVATERSAAEMEHADGRVSDAAAVGEARAPLRMTFEQRLTHSERALMEQAVRSAKLREANEQLVLSALTAHELREAVEKTHRRQMEFLAVVAHELRAPLTPIRVAATLLKRVSREELPRMQAIIERQVANMSRLVGDLLDVSRFNTGKLRLECKAFDLIALLHQSVDACRPAIDIRLQNLNVQIPSGPLECLGDALRLSQVFTNLLDNASKYTPSGGSITFQLEHGDGFLRLTVTDTGIGISAQALPHVFDPFVQDHHATGFNGEGLGIGLTVVRELVEAHGGRVTGSSAGVGEGSQFVVSLPESKVVK